MEEKHGLIRGPSVTGVTGELTAQVVCGAAGAALQSGLGAVLTPMKIRALSPVVKTDFCLNLLPTKAYLA